MNTISPKQLIDLAKACRKAGISHFKCGDVEFTLGDAPARGSKAGSPQGKQSQFKEDFPSDGWDSLTPEEQLFFSAAPGGLPVGEGSES